MKLVYRPSAAALITGLVLSVTACTSTVTTGSVSPETSSSTAPASPTPSPSPDPLKIASLPFHNGEVGFGYAAVTLGASGGTAPYSWSIVAGTFPPGLSLSSDGGVSGSSTTAGGFGFTVSVSDSAGQAATAPAKVNVYAAIAVAQPCASRCSIGAGCTRCGTFGTVRGGLGPYNYRISGGGVPRGMTWSALSVNGPFPQGAYSLSVLITDSAGGSATVGANWNIYGPATLGAGSACLNLGNPPQCTTAGWSYAGGHPTVAPKLVILSYSQYCDVNGFCYPVPTSPPQGWSVSVKGGAITISAGGLPCSPNVPYGGILTLALVDTTSCPTASQSNPAKLTVFLENNC